MHRIAILMATICLLMAQDSFGQPYYIPQTGEYGVNRGPWVRVDTATSTYNATDTSMIYSVVRCTGSYTGNWTWWGGGTADGSSSSYDNSGTLEYSTGAIHETWTRTDWPLFRYDVTIGGVVTNLGIDILPTQKNNWLLGKWNFSQSSPTWAVDGDHVMSSVTATADHTYSLKPGDSATGRDTKFVGLTVWAYPVEVTNSAVTPLYEQPIPFDKIHVGGSNLNADCTWLMKVGSENYTNVSVPLQITVDGITNYTVSFEPWDVPIVTITRSFHAYLLTNAPAAVSLANLQALYDEGTLFLGRDQDERIPDYDARVQPPQDWVANTVFPGVNNPFGAGSNYWSDHVPSYVEFNVVEGNLTGSTNSLFPVNWQGTNFHEMKYFDVDDLNEVNDLNNAAFAQLKLVRRLPVNLLGVRPSGDTSFTTHNMIVAANTNTLNATVLIHEWMHSRGLYHRGDPAMDWFSTPTVYRGNNPSANDLDRWKTYQAEDSDAILYPTGGTKVNRHERDRAFGFWF